VLFSFSELLVALLTLFVSISSIKSDIEPHGFSWRNTIKAFIQKGKFCFFLSNDPGVSVFGHYLVGFEGSQISPGDIFIGLGYGIMTFIFLLSYNITLAFSLTGVLTLWLAVNEFYNQSVLCLESSLHPPESGDRPKEHKPFYTVHKKYDKEKLFSCLLESYTEVKQLATKINETLGGLFLGTIFLTTFYFAINLEKIFVQEKGNAKVVIYYFVIKTILFFILSGDICRKVKLNCSLFHSWFQVNLSDF